MMLRGEKLHNISPAQAYFPVAGWRVWATADVTSRGLRHKTSAFKLKNSYFQPKASEMMRRIDLFAIVAFPFVFGGFLVVIFVPSLFPLCLLDKVFFVVLPAFVVDFPGVGDIHNSLPHCHRHPPLQRGALRLNNRPPDCPVELLERCRRPLPQKLHRHELQREGPEDHPAPPWIRRPQRPADRQPIRQDGERRSQHEDGRQQAPRDDAAKERPPADIEEDARGVPPRADVLQEGVAGAAELGAEDPVTAVPHGLDLGGILPAEAVERGQADPGAGADEGHHLRADLHDGVKREGTHGKGRHAVRRGRRGGARARTARDGTLACASKE